MRQVGWFQWTRILSFYLRWEKQDYLLPIMTLKLQSSHTQTPETDKNDYWTLSEKMEWSMPSWRVLRHTWRPSQHVTLDRAAYKRPSVYSEVCLQCTMQTTNNHNVVVRIVNSCLYFYLNFVNILNIYMFITVGIVYATRYTV